jgi:hypothetical protein
MRLIIKNNNLKIKIVIFLFLITPIAVFAGNSEKNIILQNVPFASQAPNGNWKDPRQQDACEEASALMAIKWARGEKINRQKIEKEIIAIAEFEKKIYKNFKDTSALDTAERIIKNYYQYKNIEVIENADINKIREELKKNNIIIMPTNGRELKNPYYTQPGPERHNLLIIGYDFNKKEFITNDPGTRRGKNYRYGEKIIAKAMRDYPTGDHLPIKELKKAIIIIKK